ncbi:MAG: CotH kinase family protein [Bacteroidia bacterium]
MVLFCSIVSRAQSFYDSDTIQKIELYFSQSNWDYQLDTSKLGSGTYLLASVKLNGVYYDSVGVKYKGNSSYDSVNAKNPFHIELNTFREQNHEGYTDIKLSNAYGDPSLIREVLSYRILNNYMKSPKSAFAELYVNDKYIGLYSSAESINEKYCERNFYSSHGTFIKGNPSITPGPAVKSNLKYLGEDTSSYYNYYELKSAAGWTDLKELCYIITNKPEDLSNIFDIDKALWMLAFNNLFVNLDSYSGVFAQNYYLYKDQLGVFNPIVWDVNMNFGAFPFAGSPNNGMGSLSVTNMQQLSPLYHSTHSDWPLIQTLFSNAKWKRKYLAHLKTMLSEMMDSSVCFNLADSYQSLIRKSVLADSNKFFSNSQFEGSLNTNYTFGSYQVPGIKTIMNARATYLKSTTELNVLAPEINSITFSNNQPSIASTVKVSVRVNHANQVYFSYRNTARELFKELELFDDGAHDDGAAADGVFANLLTIQNLSTQYFIYAENTDVGTFSPARAQHEFYYLGAQPYTLTKGKVFINEVLASNDKSDINEYGIFTDWIELYNSSSETVSLFGSYLSDDIKNPYKYAFPSHAKIEPGKFLVVWADGLTNTEKYCHANFSLESTGDEVLLSNSNGLIIDSISFAAQSADVSFGRCPDASSNFVQIYPATFQELNKFFCVAGLSLSDSKKNWLVYPNPILDELHVENTVDRLKQIKIYNLFGKEVWSSAPNEFTSEVNLSGLTSGVYILEVLSQTNQKGLIKIIKK